MLSAIVLAPCWLANGEVERRRDAASKDGGSGSGTRPATHDDALTLLNSTTVSDEVLFAAATTAVRRRNVDGAGGETTIWERRTLTRYAPN